MKRAIDRIEKDKRRWGVIVLIVLLASTLVGWVSTTWFSLKPLQSSSVQSPQLRDTSDQLAFLQPTAPKSFVIRVNPFAWRPVIPDRREPPPPPPTHVDEPVEVVFNGTMIGQSGRLLGLIRDQSRGQSHFLEIGDKFRGVRVARLNDTSLVFESFDKKIELKIGEVVDMRIMLVPLPSAIRHNS